MTSWKNPVCILLKNEELRIICYTCLLPRPELPLERMLTVFIHCASGKAMCCGDRCSVQSVVYDISYLMTCTHITDTTLHLVISWGVFFLYLFADDLPLPQVKGKTDKLLRTSTDSSNAHWFLWRSLCSETLMSSRHISFWLHVLTVKLTTNSLLNMNGANSVYYGEIFIHLDRTGPLNHLNQMTISTFFNLLSVWNPFPILLLGEWIQCAQIRASVPSECF